MDYIDVNSVYNLTDFTYANALSLHISLSAVKGLYEIMKTNLGINGTLKMLISNSGDSKITKNGFTLLQEMQIQNPIASLIARTISAQNYRIGDGTTSIIVILGETFKHIEKYIEKGVHPQILYQGMNLGKRELDRWLSTQKFPLKVDKNTLFSIAKSVLSTKLKSTLSKKLADILSEAILTVYREGEEIDIQMIEIISIENQIEFESRFVKGIVLDHGSRHSGMPNILYDSFILLCNISLEYETTEFESEISFNCCDNQQKFLLKEREYVDQKVKKIIQIKRSVCKDKKKGFLVVNQKGIDTLSLDLLAKEGILAVRRAKRQNLERISLMCNAVPVNSIDDIKPEILGYAGLVYEQIIGDEKFTFIENVTNPFSGTILIKGKNIFLRQQIKDAIKSGLMSLKIFSKDKCALHGGGQIEIQANKHLTLYSECIKGKKKFGVIALAKGMLSIPKILSENSGDDPYKYYSYISKNIAQSYSVSHFSDLNQYNILDCWTVKKQIYESVVSLASTVLLIDEILLGRGLQ